MRCDATAQFLENLLFPGSLFSLNQPFNCSLLSEAGSWKNSYGRLPIKSIYYFFFLRLIIELILVKIQEFKLYCFYSVIQVILPQLQWGARTTIPSGLPVALLQITLFRIVRPIS